MGLALPLGGSFQKISLKSYIYDYLAFNPDNGSLIGLTNSRIPLSFRMWISLISAPYCRSIPVESWLPTQIAASVIGPATKQILSDDPLQITASLIGLTNSRIPLSFSTWISLISAPYCRSILVASWLSTRTAEIAIGPTTRRIPINLYHMNIS